jgi:hypothetical protein
MLEKKTKGEHLPHGDFFFDTEQGGRSLPEIKKKDQFDAPNLFS